MRERAKTGGAALLDPDVWEESEAKARDMAAPASLPTAPKLRARTLADLARTVETAVTWVVTRIIPAGGALVLLAAFMKVGKSHLVYALIAAVLRGVPFLARDPSRARPAAGRRGAGAGRADPAALVWRARRRPAAGPRGHPAGLAGDVARAASYIHELRPALVVVDTLTRFWSVSDENDNSQVNREAAVAGPGARDGLHGPAGGPRRQGWRRPRSLNPGASADSLWPIRQ